MTQGTKRTKVICLYGGPGTGKSTTGADLFAKLKIRQKSCELVREYVKDWVWEGRAVQTWDQVYILAKQARKEQILYGVVDFVITDAPMWLSAIYEPKYGAFPYICDDIVAKFEKEANARGVEFIHIFLNRVKPYQAEGRHQDEAGAREIDAELKEYLTRARIPIIEVDADDGAAERIISLLRI